MNILKSKRAFFIFFAIFIVSLAVLTVVLLQKKSDNPIQTTINTQSSLPTAVAIHPSSLVKQQTIVTQNYRVQLLQNWKPQFKTITSGGSQDEINIPQNIYYGVSNPKIIIQKTPVITTPLSQVENVFVALDYTRSTFTIDNIQSSAFTGHIKLIKDFLFEKAIVFQKKDDVYLIKLSYISSARNVNLEHDFYQTIKTFTFF